MNNITNLIDGVKNVTASGWDSLKTIADFLNFIIHPSLIIQALWNFTETYAFWVCLLIAILAAVFYALGFKKFAKYIPGSMAVFTLIKMLGSAF